MHASYRITYLSLFKDPATIARLYKEKMRMDAKFRTMWRVAFYSRFFS
jgi:hypothetical protein